MRRRPSAAGKPRKARSAPKRKARPDPETLPAETVSLLFDQLRSEERSESAWRSIFSPERDEDERAALEDGLRPKPREGGPPERRWKFFGK